MPTIVTALAHLKYFTHLLNGKLHPVILYELVDFPSLTEKMLIAFFAELSFVDTVTCILNSQPCPITTTMISVEKDLIICCDTFCVADAAFSWDTVCVGDSMCFTPDTTGLGWVHFWDFGDTNTDTVTAPCHLYDSIGTYIVTHIVSGLNCIADTVIDTVTVITFPVAGFAYSDTGLCVGNPINFINTTTGTPASFLWNFGDGGNSTLVNPSHIYNQSGTFVVTLIATNSCGSDTAKEFITIIQDCCASPDSFNYDIKDTVITATQVWSGLNKTVERTITIEPGAWLFLNNTTLWFSPIGMIVVKPGGKLVLQNVTQLMSMSSVTELCDVMWQGIQVWGDSASPPSFVNQGVLYSYGVNPNVIRDAHIGILAGKTDSCILDSSCTLGYDLAYSGGMVFVNNTTFSNNGIDVKFMPYSFNDVSQISNSYLNGGVLLDPQYNTVSPNPYPNPYNPWYAPANTLGRTHFGIWQWGVKKIKFRDNHFSDMEKGMESYDAKYDVISNLYGPGHTFSNLTYGIRIFNTNSTIDNRHLIRNCTFNEVDISVWIDGGLYDRVKANFFNPNQGLQWNNLIGVYMNNSSRFRVVDNEFYRLLYGAASINSGNSYSYIGYESNYNYFRRCRYGIVTFFNNSNLTLKCNRHYNPNSSEYLRNWYNFGNLADQGFYHTNPWLRHFFAAGNEFFPSNRKHILSFNSYNYYHHSTLSTKPTPLGPITLYDVNVPIWGEFSCVKLFKPIPVVLALMDSLSGRLVTLQTELDSVLNILDGGNTQPLLDAISGNTPYIQLRNMLVGESPLSDTVVIAAIERQNPLPAEYFKQVMIPNSPVAKKARPYLDTILQTLPPVIASEIREVQPGNPNFRTVTTIIRGIKATKMERQLLLNEVVARLIADTLDTTARQAAINLLELENTINANQALAATYLADGNLTAAQAKLNAIPGNPVPLQQWKALTQMLIDLAAEGKTVFEMDAQQEQLVRNLAYSQGHTSLAISNAQAILRLVYGEEFPLNFSIPNEKTGGDEPQTSSEGEQENDALVSETLDWSLGNNIPNPFSNSTVIPYQVPEGSTGLIKIYGIRGELISEYQLLNGKNELAVSFAEVSTGIYYYCLFIDGVKMQTKRMAVMKK